MKYTRKVLTNGIRLVTITELPTAAATITAYIKSGFRYDPIERPGLSHFAEHVVFNHAKSSPNSVLSQAVDRHGGWRSAFTWIEHQKHMVHLPKDNFEDGIRLILKTIFEPFVKKSEIEKEKGVVKEEILTNRADPSKGIWDYAWFPLFFQGSHLARPYSGTIDDILAISKSDVESFIFDYFQTKNTVILVAGDLEPTYIQSVIEKHSKKKEKRHKEKSIAALNPKNERNILVHQDNSYYQTSLVIGIKTVPFSSPLKYVFDILQEMLSGYFGAPLIQRLRDKGGLIYAWNAFQDNISDTGYLMLNVSTAHENVYKVISIILDEFTRLASGSFLKEEVEIAKGHLIGSIVANIERGQDYIDWYGMQELLDVDNVLSIQQQIAIYKKISDQEIKRVASYYLARKNILIGVLGRAKEEELERLISIE